ncbi:MAG: NAD(P)-dependent oxidoreductase [Pseudomonadota bacterium]
MSRPLILLDPYPRTEAMVWTDDTRAEVEAMARVVSRFGSRAPDTLVEEVLPEVTIIVGQTPMPTERLARAPNLRAILNVKANWEPNVDYAAAQARGIHVLSAAPAMAPAVAEMALGQAIALGRGTVAADLAMRAGEERYGIAGNGGASTLYGARVGLVGFGNLGRALVPLLAPFGCEISAHDPWVSTGHLRRHGVTPATLEEVLAESEVLFLLAGVTTENEGFLSRERLETIREGASVLLISRAEIVDFDVLVALADAGRFCAAIDVYPEEPVPADAPVRQARNVLLSAHLAGGMEASYARIRAMMVEDIAQILAGRPPMAMQRAEPALAAISRSR